MVNLLIRSKCLISISYYFSWRANGWSHAAQTLHLVHPHSLIITRMSALSPARQHTCSWCPIDTVLCSKEPMTKGHGCCPDRTRCPGQGAERPLLLVRPMWPWTRSSAWRPRGSVLPGVCRGARGRLPGSRRPFPTPPPVPAVLKHSHQIGHRCRLLLTCPIHPAGLQGGPQLPLKQGGRLPAKALSTHPTPRVTEGLRHSGICSLFAEGSAGLLPASVQKEEVVPKLQP